MSEYFWSVLESFWAPLLYLSTPERRIYLPFLLSSLILAAAVVAWRNRKLPAESRESLWNALFGREVWLHESSILDFKLIFAKSILRAVLIAPLMIPKVWVAALVAAILKLVLGDDLNLGLGEVGASAIFMVVAFLVEDWSRYLLHKWLHRVPFLWELHKVHHSAEVLTPVTLYRSHPLEGVLYSFRDVLFMGTAIGICYPFLGNNLNVFHILGVDVIGFAFSLVGANLRHSHVWVSYGERLEKWFISPAQHQIHHSDNPIHFDRNFGAFLAIWDRIGGSLYVPRGKESLTFGLDEEEKNHDHRLWSAIWGPLRASWRRFWRRSSTS